MGSIIKRITAVIHAVRQRRPFVDHLLLMQEHFGKVQAGQQAGAATYFGFLSFFPILALAFFVVGYVAKVYPAAQGQLLTAIEQVLPGLIGNREGQVQLVDIQAAAGAVGLIGVVTLLYAGLSWLSALRQGLFTVFELPSFEQPNFFVGKLRDLITLFVIGVTLLLSVAVSGFVSAFSSELLGLVNLDNTLSPVLKVGTYLLGLAANALLFYAMFKLLSDTETPRRSLVQGALLGAIGFELLKRLSGVLLAGTQGSPAFQAFGIALILIVWINYFSRLILYAAAFAYTTREAREQRVSQPAAPVQGPQLPGLVTPRHAGARWVTPFAVGGGAMLGLIAWLRKKDS